MKIRQYRGKVLEDEYMFSGTRIEGVALEFEYLPNRIFIIPDFAIICKGFCAGGGPSAGILEIVPESLEIIEELEE